MEPTAEVKKEPQVKRFSEQARERLLSNDYKIFELTGRTIRSYREEGRLFSDSDSSARGDFEDLPSILSEVAIYSGGPIIPESEVKLPSQQLQMLAAYNEAFSKRF